LRSCGCPLVVVLLAHAYPLLLMCPVDSPQFCVELGPKSLILLLLELHQLLLPMETAGGWVPSLMGVVKALPQGLKGVLVSRAYSLLSALLLLHEASPLLGMGFSNEIHACLMLLLELLQVLLVLLVLLMLLVLLGLCIEESGA